MTRAAIFFSGRGSNMAALLQAARDPSYPASFALALTNIPDAPGLAIAQAHGIPSAVVAHHPFGPDRNAHEHAIQAVLQAHRIEIVCLAGYMRRLTPYLVDAWSGRMINIHPSLLPTFPGLDTHRRALAAGVKLHGCTVHLVTHEIDGGPILAQAAVPVLPDDDEPTLAARVLAQEHILYPLALAARLTNTPHRPDPASALLN